MAYSRDPQLDKRIREAAEHLARGGPLFLWGGVGSGKTHLVRWIHRETMPGTPLVFQEAAGLERARFESQFFGHVRGAFSGAVSDFRGLAGASEGGLLCIEGVEGLEPENQARILRFLQERRYRPLGAVTERSWRGALAITAQHSPETLRGKGHLRDDFYFRIAAVSLGLPELSARTVDFDDICRIMVADIEAELDLPLRRPGKAEVQCLSGKAIEGNFHGLRNLLQQAMIRGEAPRLGNAGDREELGSLPDTGTLRGDLAILEKRLLERALAEGHRTRDELARDLGISKRTLLYKLEKHDLDRAQS